MAEDDYNSLNLPNDKDQNEPKEANTNQNDRKIFKCGEEVTYGITFIARIIISLYSFHGLFFMLNFLVQFIILVPGVLYEINSTSGQIILSIIYIFFSLFASTLLIIPTYELLQFPFLRYRNVLAHLESLAIVKNIIGDDDNACQELVLNKNRDWVDILLIVIEISYLIGFFLGFSSITSIFTDIVHIVILSIIYFYYLVLYFGYIVISFYLMYKLIIHINNCCQCFCDFFCGLEKHIKHIESFFENKTPLPKINLFCYIINPILTKSYLDKNGKNLEKLKFSGLNKCFIGLKKVIRIILFFGSFFLAIFAMVKKNAFSIIFFLLFYIFMFFLSFMMNFPYFVRNKNTNSFKEFWSPTIYYDEKYKLEYPKLITILRIINLLIIFLASLGLVFSFFSFDEKNSLDEISSLTFTSSTGNTDTDANLLLPNICTSKINNIPIYLYMPFINDAYYFNDNPSSLKTSFEIDGYKDLFFDNTFTINVVGNLIEAKQTENNEDQVKMIQYDVTKDGKEITILSIKGTSNKKDLFLDMQLYFPSILLNLLTTFSVFGQQKDTLYFGFLEYGLSIPYRIFSQYLIVDGYLNDLLIAYNNNENKFKSNVVIVGHSLGGGLCKILGRLVNKQAISLNGPGVNAFHSLWGYAGKSENFEISAIDLVPDMDLVPRVEVSGGTVYRIVCKEGPLDCHAKNLSLCEVLIMCRSPNYVEYCTKMAGLNDRQIKKIVRSTELNPE